MDSTFFLFLLYFTITTAATPDEDTLPLFDYDFGTTGMEHIGGVSNFPAIENVSFAFFQNYRVSQQVWNVLKNVCERSKLRLQKSCILLQKIAFSAFFENC